MKHTHTPLVFRPCVIFFPNMRSSFCRRRWGHCRRYPLEDDQRSRNHPVAIFWNGNIWGSPSAMEHAYTVLILEFFFGGTLWGLILRDILSWLEVMCHWSLRKLITWLSFNGLYKNIGAKNTSSVRFFASLLQKNPIWSIQMFNGAPVTSSGQNLTRDHPPVFTVHGLIGMLYWVPKVDN